MNKRFKERWTYFWREWIRPLGTVALVVFSFRSSIADWNDVPTGSMKPSIIEGDRVFVNKLAYDLKIPFTRMRIAEWGDPERGDVVVFFAPTDGTRMVKRVIGLPGDRIELLNNQVFVNGEALAYEELDSWFVEQIPAAARPAHLFASELLADRKHPMMITPNRPAPRTGGPFVVPEGHYFMMGDNRDNSLDSRFYGAVARDRIVGRSTAVVFSFEPDRWLRPRWGRFFESMP